VHSVLETEGKSVSNSKSTFIPTFGDDESYSLLKDFLHESQITE